jgi:DNA repair exonuclease SbcCD nuclease subunit
MKILIIPDFHYGRYTNKSIEEGLVAVQKQIIETCIKYKIEIVFFIGDLVRKKDLQKMDLQVLFELSEFIKSLNKIVDSEVYAISGNHDQFNDNFLMSYVGRSSKSVIDLLTLNILDDKMTFLEKDCFALGVPFYREGNDFMKIIENVKFNECESIILHCHQTPKGSGYESSDMVDFTLPIFRKFTKIYCGHIHEPKEFLNVIQTGSCLAYKSNEQSDKFLYIFDTETMENESIKIDFQVSYDNQIQTIKKDTQISSKLKAKESIFDIEKGIESYSKTQIKKEKVLEYGIKLFNKTIKS